MRNIQQDNTGIAERKLAVAVRKKLIPQANKLFRTTKLPSDLDAIERQYIERVEWPRSIYKYKILLDACNHFTNVIDTPYTNGLELMDTISHPWVESSRFNVDLTLARNKRALKKAASLPMFGKKQDNIAAAKQYVESVIKSSSSIQDMYSIMPGYRTQQSSPDSPKVRLVWAFPVTTWLMECEAYDDGITKTISENKNEHTVKLFYCAPEEIHQWYNDVSNSIQHWANLDATSYDAYVCKSELSEFIRSFTRNYEFAALLDDYQARASLVLPEGDLVRNGGMPSGSKITNVGDGWTNVVDTLEYLERCKLLRYLEAILVNGDDISLGFSTKLTKSNIEKFNRYSRREIHPEKSRLGATLWNSKFYIDDDLMTRPLYRVLNSMMFKEHQTNPITGSKEYVTIAYAQQVKDIEQHPVFESLLPTLLEINKYPVSGMIDDPNFKEAADAYVDEHFNAQVYDSTESFIRSLKESRLVEAGG
jgi:hypothetical protein